MKRFLSVLALCLVMVMVIGPIAGNAAAYSSFTYDHSGFELLSPDGYSPKRTVTSEYMGLRVDLNEPTDIVTDADANPFSQKRRPKTGCAPTAAVRSSVQRRRRTFSK